MYKAYLVDDDSLILEELLNTVPWQDNGFLIAGHNTDPVKAIDEIVKAAPDVVFLDMKMPEMDGNTLVAHLREKGVDTEFVMISAYNEFEQVRKFFRQEGFDYILKPVSNDAIQALLEQLVDKLSEKKPYKESEAFMDDDPQQKSNPGFNSMIDYINEHFKEKITLDSLSSMFFFSRSYICRLFQEKYGKTLNGYLSDLRMKRAEKLLKEKKLLIKEVAYECGYSDYYNFFKVFKKYYGISPQEMRDQKV